MYLSIVVPAFNEAPNLEKTINEFNSYLQKQDYSYELIVVNDGSTDKTAHIIESLKKKFPYIILVDNKENHGKGKVVKQGFQKAKGDYCLFIDADNATTIDNLDKVWTEIRKDNDIVIASRSHHDHPDTIQEIKQPLWKRSLGICGNRIIQFLTVRNIWDTQCGFKLFSKNALNTILPRMTIKRWMFDVEMLLIGKKHNLKIGIIPVIWRNSDSSRVGINGYLKSLRDIILIRKNIWSKKYD